MKTKPVRAAAIQPRLRVRVGDAIALGPGKVELLKLVQQTGSITDAARLMRMSYMRAWMLIQTMNRCFKQPLVLTARGGQRGGGAELTETGRKVVACYQAMEKTGLRAIAGQWRQLRSLLLRGSRAQCALKNRSVRPGGKSRSEAETILQVDGRG